MNWLLSRPIAHRGLHDATCPKNSLSAFKRAIDHGFPFEIDVRLTKDEVLVVCHDDEFTDYFGKKGVVSELTYDQLKTYSLSASGERIPTFEEVKTLTDGKVGILIELKNHSSCRRTEEVLLKELESYKGPYAVQNFNPLSIAWFKKNAPHVKRGVLSYTFSDNTEMSKLRKFLLSNLLLDAFAKPDFIAHLGTELPRRAVRRTRLPVLAWTVTSEEKAWDLINNGHANNIIFEDFLPSEKLLKKISG